MTLADRLGPEEMARRERWAQAEGERADAVRQLEEAARVLAEMPKSKYALVSLRAAIARLDAARSRLLVMQFGGKTDGSQ